VAVDDTAYLAFARHISAQPFDPYGFTFFWYTVPDDAFEIICPPVVPYWLALGIALFGEQPALLKLWLYPFLFLFAWSARELLRGFARGSQDGMLPPIVLSPAILPTVNLMLDIPALALGLAAIVLFIRSTERSSWHLAVASGLVTGLAMQTKYTALLIPPAIGWFGITHWRASGLKLSAIAVATALVVFSGWESLLVAKYGRSHFAFHVSDQQSSMASESRSLNEFIQEKSYLVPPLTGYLGCLGIGNGLLAIAALGLPRRAVVTIAFIWSAGFCWIIFTPSHWSMIFIPQMAIDTSFVSTFWQTSGALVLLSLVVAALLLTIRVRNRLGFRCNQDSLFLAGWLLIELGGYFALTPFGAARRVIGLVVVGGFLTSRLMNRLGRIHPNRHGSRWIIAFPIAIAVAVAAIDTLDAYPEKVCAERCALLVADRNDGATAWFAGHWGFQYYCTRAGMSQIVPGQTILSAGDFLVLPIHPDDPGFYRPHIGSVPIRPPHWAVEKIQEVIWNDPLAAQTVPNFYGGVDPVIGRDHPRLRVIVYRVIREWKVPR
jgi:4-amino-4-deoxy-L-arabinose transferase-like glycosyltransferase